MHLTAQSLLTLSFFATVVAASHRAHAAGYQGSHGHPMPRRQAPPASAGQSTYTYITPSPGAMPVPITQQYQTVTSFAPVITVCPLASQPPREPLEARAPPDGTGASSIAGKSSNASNSSCATEYSPTLTTVCHTTLQALMSAETVTACDQQVTFSERLGYSLSVPSGVSDAMTLLPSASPQVETVTTLYVAPWTDLTSGAGLPSSVTEKVCTAARDASSGTVCVDKWVEPRTTAITSTKTSTTELQLTTNIPGPARVTVRTITLDITNTDSVIALSTQFITEYSVETTSLTFNTRQGGGASTVTVHPVAASAIPSADGDASLPSTPSASAPANKLAVSGQASSSSSPTALSTSTRTTTVSVTVNGDNATSTTVETNTHTATESVTMTRPLSLATPQLKLGNSTTSA